MTDEKQKNQEIISAIQEMMNEVEEMPIGGNLMKILEQKIPELNIKITKQAIKKRNEINQVRKDDFSPSDSLSKVQKEKSEGKSK